MRFRSFILWYTFAASTLFGADVPSLEFWFFRPIVPIADVKSDGVPGFGSTGNPRIVAEGATQSLQVENIRWQDDALRIGKLQGNVKIDALQGVFETLGQKVRLFDYRNVNVQVRSRAELVLTFPSSMRLSPEVVDRRVSFRLADDSLKQHIDRQVEAYFAPESFQKHFEITIEGFPSLVKEFASQEIEKQKKHLLAQARAGMQKALSPDALANVLVVGQQALPAGFPVELIEGPWVFSRRTSELGRDGKAAVLWRLAPESATSSSYSIPIQAGNNVLTVLLSPRMIQLLIQDSLRKQAGEEAVAQGWSPMGEAESVAAARVFGIEATQGPLGIVLSGQGEPQIAVWSLPGKKNFLDVVLTLRAAEGPGHRVGATLEFGEEGVPRLVNLALVGDPSRDAEARASDGWAAFQQALGKTILTGLANGKLDDVHGRWMTGSDNLTPMGIRCLGLRGERIVGMPQYQFAEVLAVDFLMK